MCPDFNILLDVAHLKVSCNSLSLNFIDELNKFLIISDYLHISDNDSLNDSNKYINKKSELYSILSKHQLGSKIITLEIYDEIHKIKSSYNLLSKK